MTFFGIPRVPTLLLCIWFPRTLQVLTLIFGLDTQWSGREWLVLWGTALTYRISLAPTCYLRSINVPKWKRPMYHITYTLALCTYIDVVTLPLTAGMTFTRTRTCTWVWSWHSDSVASCVTPVSDTSASLSGQVWFFKHDGDSEVL